MPAPQGVGRQARWSLGAVLALLLLALGTIHNFVAAPMSFDALSERALWFIAAGLALWYAGLVNLLVEWEPHPSPLLRAAALATNGTLLAFVVTFAAVRGRMADPASLLLVGAVVVLAVRSALGLRGRRRGVRE